MKVYKVQYWFQNRDDYDFKIVSLLAISPAQAIRKAKLNAPIWAKDFKVI